LFYGSGGSLGLYSPSSEPKLVFTADQAAFTDWLAGNPGEIRKQFQNEGRG
jgi:hypothetical protein